MAILVQAWSLPQVGAGHQRLIAFVPAISGSFSRKKSGVGDGRVTLNSGYPRLLDICDPSNEVETLLKVYIDGEEAYSFFARFASEPYGDGPNKLIDFYGPGIEDVLNWAIVFPFDYPARPSLQPDHAYGSSNTILQNAGFEDGVESAAGSFENASTDGWSEASLPDPYTQNFRFIPTTTESRTGTYSLQVEPGTSGTSGVSKSFPVVPGGQTTIDVWVMSNTSGKRITMWAKQQDDMSDASPGGFVINGYIIVEQDGAAEGAGVSVAGTWQRMRHIIIPGPDQTSVEISVVAEYADDTIFYIDDWSSDGWGVGVSPWVPIEFEDGPPTVFEVSTEQAHTGLNSLKITGPAGAGTLQHNLQFIPGATYTASAWFYHEKGSDNQFRIQLEWPGFVPLDNTLLYLATFGTVPTGVWTRIQFTFQPPQEVMNLAIVNDQTGDVTWYLDDVSVAAGLPATTIGGMTIDLMEDATVDHVAETAPGAPRTVLDFLAYGTIAVDTDSDNVAWVDPELPVIVTRGQTYSQVMHNIWTDYQYEVEIIPNPNFPAEPEPYELKIYNPGGMGTDYTALSTPGLVAGQIDSGDIVRGTPARNHVFAEGSGQDWREVQNSGDATAYQRREVYIGDTKSAAGTAITALASAQLDIEDASEYGVKLTIDGEAAIRAFRDFNVGDTIPINLGTPGVAPSYRVQVITFTFEVASNTAKAFLDLNREVFTDNLESAVEGVNKLLSQFQSLPEADLSPLGTGLGAFEGPIEVTYLVAAWNERSEIRALADYVCDGVDDDVEINMALTQASVLRVGIAAKALVRLSTGEFNFADGATLTVPNGVALLGYGRRVTWLVNSGAFNIVYGSNCEIGNFRITPPIGS